MKFRSDLVELELSIRNETEKAILVWDGRREAWLPKSQIDYVEDGRGGVEVTLPEWLAKDKELI